MPARVCAVVLAVALLAPSPAAASLAIDDLQNMVAGLGFETSGDHKTYVAIEHQTVADATIFFAIDGTGSSLNIYLPFPSISKDKVAGIPATDMLKFNNQHDFAFAIGRADSKERVVLEKTIDASTVTPVTLRKSIDSLKAAVDDGRRLWKQDGWPSAVQAQAGASKAYLAALAAADAIWMHSPFELHHLMFVTEKPSVFGAYKRRDGNVFKIGEPMLTYVEPFGYAWKPTEDGSYRFGVSLDYTLLDGDKILSEQQKVLTYSNASKEKIREFMLNLSLNFTGLFPGKYNLRYTAHDMFSDRASTATIPFEIAE